MLHSRFIQISNELLPHTSKAFEYAVTKIETLREQAHGVLIHGAPYQGQNIWAQYIAMQFLESTTDQNISTLIENNTHPDLHYFPDKGTTFTISEARSLTNTLALSPQGASHVVVIENIDRMTREAANSLLKTIEEPASDVFFLCTTARKNHILPTILSRMLLLPTPIFSKESLQHTFENHVPSFKELGNNVTDICTLYPEILYHIDTHEEEAESITSKIEELLQVSKSIASLRVSIGEKIDLGRFLFEKQKQKEDPILTTQDLFLLLFEKELQNTLHTNITNTKAQQAIAKIYTSFIQYKEDIQQNCHKKLAFEHFLLSSYL